MTKLLGVLSTVTLLWPASGIQKATGRAATLARKRLGKVVHATHGLRDAKSYEDT